MINVTWRKRFSILQNRLYLYPSPDPLPRTRGFWLALGLVTCAAALFSAYFILYLTGRHDAFLTNAEDFGIMDQAIWNTVHGHMLHQTICNIVSDTNCYSPDGINRFALHFEPILFPISLLYLIWPDPRTLLVVQTLIVASGAYAAFLLARLRLRNEWAAAAIAVLYLFYPAQQQATAFDFHAVTFTASLLLFTIYFMYTRRTVWLFVFAILAMACKEEIPVVIVIFGLWSMLFQRRWRSGLGLVLLSMAWLGLTFLIIIPHFSPTGQHLLASRYEQLGKGPLAIISNTIGHPVNFFKLYIKEPLHLAYLHSLLAPAGFLPLLAPWVLVLAVPSIAFNLLSSDKQMYSGLFQYNAEIVPVLIFATIEAMVLVLWLVQVATARLRISEAALESSKAALVSERAWLPARWIHAILLVLMLGITLAATIRADYYFYGQLPFSKGFTWPAASAHTALAQRFIDMIPPDASVSAQTKLVPHLSHRTSIYMFPYQDDKADYIFLDVTGDIYPYFGSAPYIREVKNVLLSGNYGIVAAQEGYLLLKHGLPAPGVSPYSVVKPVANSDNSLVLPDLPESFCSNIYVSPQKVTHPLQATFTGPGGSMSLIGFDSSASNIFSHSGGYMNITTYWRVSTPIAAPLQVLLLVNGSNGKEYFASTDVPALLWCQTNTWKPGMVVQVTSRLFGLQASQVPNGLAYMSIALLPLVQSSSKIMDVQARLPLHLVTVPHTVTSTQDSNALQLMPIKIVR
ncbi:MAG: DUF2079 domain-containing protein [Chloroflexi bacterium]|nr:DUF2079 domain-containing protein [Chloroflexota bacterium]